jgi:hypothetical protein
VATRPERRPRDQDRRGAARCRPVFPFGIGTKAANRTIEIRRSLYLISRTQFLHFTVNHYRQSGQWFFQCGFQAAKECLCLRNGNKKTNLERVSHVLKVHQLQEILDGKTFTTG